MISAPDHADRQVAAWAASLADPDACFSLLSDACRDLDAEQGHLLHAQLVLLLMQHIGDIDLLRDAIEIAREGLQ